MQLLQSFKHVDFRLEIYLPVEVFPIVCPEEMGSIEALMVIHYPGLTFSIGGIYCLISVNGFRWKFLRLPHRNASFLVFDYQHLNSWPLNMD